MGKFSFIIFWVLLTYARNPTQLNKCWILFLSAYCQNHSLFKLHFTQKVCFTFTDQEALGSWFFVTKGVASGQWHCWSTSWGQTRDFIIRSYLEINKKRFSADTWALGEPIGPVWQPAGHRCAATWGERTKSSAAGEGGGLRRESKGWLLQKKDNLG